jgi:hypothetical protein
MKRHALIPVLAALLGCALAAQEDPAKPQKPDKEVADKLAELKKIVADKKFERDAEGATIIEALFVKLRAGVHDKDRDALADGMEGVLMTGKVRDPGNLSLYRVAATLLGELGPDGAPILRKAYDNKRFPEKPEWVPLREILLKGIGKTKDEKSVKFLIDEARRAPESALMKAAGEALGNFEGSNQKIRDEIVKGLLTRYGELDSRSRQIDPGDIEAQNARDYLAAISDPWNTTLSKLTRQNFRSYPDWQDWYNKHKNEEWK